MNKDLNPSVRNHIRLSFLEANILKESMKRHGQSKENLIACLASLAENTTDQRLLQEISSLIEKIIQLTNAEFDILIEHAENGRILFPANYVLPRVEEQE